jgi:hypothetical protein
MGHRIQFLEYDTIAEQVNVTQYRSRQGFNREHGNNTSSYAYELWNKDENKFETMTQSFYQFPNPEMRWNKIDNIVVGNLPYDEAEAGVKARRLRFAVIPPPIKSEAELQKYFANFSQLIDHLNKIR